MPLFGLTQSERGEIGSERQGTRDRKRETGSERQEARDKKVATGSERQEGSDRKRETLLCTSPLVGFLVGVCRVFCISLWLQIVVLTLGVAAAATSSLWLQILVVTLGVAAGVAEESATSQSPSLTVKACISRTISDMDEGVWIGDCEV